jgi:hypothetical protein
VDDLYNEGRTAAASKLIDWANDTIQAFLLRDTYIYNAAHGFSNIAAADIIAGPEPVTSLSIDSEGWCVGEDVVFQNILYTGNSVIAAVLYDLTADRMLWYSDTLDGLPFVSVGGTYAIRLTNAQQAYFRL